MGGRAAPCARMEGSFRPPSPPTHGAVVRRPPVQVGFPPATEQFASDLQPLETRKALEDPPSEAHPLISRI